MTTKVFISLPVKNLYHSMEFFRKVGFSFDSNFSTKDAACMAINNNTYVMLMHKDFFQQFTKKAIANSHISTESIISISAGSREEAERIVKLALSSGGSVSKEPKDHGWVYECGFQDIDGHVWDIIYIDLSNKPKQ